MNLREQLNLSDEKYNFLFDIRRAIRYHERRKSFFYRVQNIASFFTIIMAGVVIMDAVKKGVTPEWMVYVGVSAALLSALDLVIGFSRRAEIHSQLREKFAELEIDIVIGPPIGDVWIDYQKRRLFIEKDEPATYFIIDGLCRNELLIADGFSPKDKKEAKHFAKINFFQRITAQIWPWENAIHFEPKQLEPTQQ
jgi:hypothetical protein